MRRETDIHEKISRWQRTLDDFSALKANLKNDRLRIFNSLLEKWEPYRLKRKETSRKEAPDFNPILLLDRKYCELTHSRILAWALDSESNHGQGDIFFRNFFIKFLSNEFPSSPYRVVTEHAMDESRIDVMVRSAEYLVFIENKTLSGEGEEQTEREHRDMGKMAESENITTTYPVYLSPAGDKPSSDKWIAVSYEQLARCMEEAAESAEPPHIQYFIKSWCETLRSISHEKIFRRK